MSSGHSRSGTLTNGAAATFYAGAMLRMSPSIAVPQHPLCAATAQPFLNGGQGNTDIHVSDAANPSTSANLDMTPASDVRSPIKEML